MFDAPESQGTYRKYLETLPPRQQELFGTFLDIVTAQVASGPAAQQTVEQGDATDLLALNAQAMAAASGSAIVGLIVIGQVQPNRGLGLQNPMYKDALSPHKGQKLTKAGRHLTKHPELVGETKDTIRNSLPTDASLNKAAATVLKDIMLNGKVTYGSSKLQGDYVQFRRSDGTGARFNSKTNQFIGFIGP